MFATKIDRRRVLFRASKAVATGGRCRTFYILSDVTDFRGIPAAACLQPLRSTAYRYRACVIFSNYIRNETRFIYRRH